MSKYRIIEDHTVPYRYLKYRIQKLGCLGWSNQGSLHSEEEALNLLERTINPQPDYTVLREVDATIKGDTNV